MPRVQKYLVSVALAMLAIAGLYVASLSVATSRLENLLYAQADSQSVGPSWNDARSQASALANAASWDGAALDLAGRVYLLDAEFARTPKENIQALRKAQSYLESAAKLRPSWPYTRLNLARVAFALDAHGPWQAHLKHALALNLRGTFLQLDLLKFRRQLGLRLTGELARAVEQSFAQGLVDAPDEMVRAAVDLGRKEWACATPINSQVKTLCAAAR
jgi:hypothetical protein